MSRMPNQKIIWLLSSVKSEIETKYNNYSKRYNESKSATEEKELLNKANVLISENKKVKAYLYRYRGLFLELNKPGNFENPKIISAINEIEVEVIKKYLTKELEAKLELKNEVSNTLYSEQKDLKKEIIVDIVSASLSFVLIFSLSGIGFSAPQIAEKAMCAVGTAMSMITFYMLVRDINRKTSIKESNENALTSIDILGVNDYLDEIGVKPHI